MLRAPPSTLRSVSDAARDDLESLHRRWAHDGDPAAREALVERYQALVRSLSSRYNVVSDSADDLIQVGNVGLLHALDRFDPDRGCAFRSFAVPTILGELRRHFRNTGWAVHVPRSLQERFMLVERVSQELAGKLGRLPTPSDIADRLGLTTEEVVDAASARNGYNTISLDHPVGHGDDDDGEDRILLDTLARDEPGYELVAYRAALEGTIRALPARERQMLSLRFTQDLTQAEIADRLGISQMQVSRLLRRSLNRLRAVAEAEGRGRDDARFGS